MSDEIRREMTGLLAAQVESYAEALEQRDRARDVAVQLEGEVHALEIERDAEIARANRAEANIASLRRDLGNLHAWPYGAGERVVKVNELLAVLDAALDSPRPNDAA